MKEQEKQDQAPATQNIKFDIQPFFVPKSFEVEVCSSLIKKTFFIKDELSVISFPHTILRPPIA